MKNQARLIYLNISLLLSMVMGDGLRSEKCLIKGHYEGMQTIKKITRIASDIGVKYLTLYAFPLKIGQDLKVK